MTTDTVISTIERRVRQIVTQQTMCVVAGVGPAGELDGSLAFDPSGPVQVTDDGLCRLPLRTIEEGSFLRAWLRISRHSLVAVPWALLFLDRKSCTSVLLSGTARLVAGAAGPDRERSAELIVEVTPTRVDHQPIRGGAADEPSPSGVSGAKPVDNTLRSLAEKPTREITVPARDFLADTTESYLCTIDRDGRPRIGRLNGALSSSPDVALHEQTVYVRTDDTPPDLPDSAPEPSSEPVLLIAPNYDARLAVRVAGTTRGVELAETPPDVQQAFAGTVRAREITVRLVGAQAGDWTGAGATVEDSGNIRVAQSVLRVHGARSIGRAEVSFVGGPTVLVRGGESLLELAESNGVPMEAGCRMGICGADPVRIDDGAENLSRIRRSEQSTLDRLGLPPGCRMACSARVQGSVTVAAVGDGAEQTNGESHSLPTADFALDPEIRRIVVIGTGIAGITAAEEVRKLHPDVDLTVVGAERHDFYNRMAISRLVDEETSPDKLSLLSPDWARRRRILYLPGVSVAAINRATREVIPHEGNALPYDRLVLAMGAKSRIPTIEGLGLAGAYALRTIDDALELRRHIQQAGVRRAVVIGGGLLGLEAAYHLIQTGLRVWIVGRGEWPADRQLDEHAGGILSQMLQDLGIEYLARSEPRRVTGHDAVEGVELKDGRVLPAGLCLVAAGIVPDATLAQDAGLEVAGGVVVNDHMQTSDPAIYAAGDVIQFQGRSFGLWPASVDQAIVAATNLLGGDLPYHATMAPAQLKVPGIDLLSVGEIAPRQPDDREIRIADRHARHYRKLVLRAGCAIGAIIIGSPGLFDGVAEAVQAGRDLTDRLDEIERGDWNALTGDDVTDEATPTLSGAR